MSHGSRSVFDPETNVEVSVDLVEVSRSHLVVRNRSDGSTHALPYDGIEIGANAKGDAYTLIMPRVLAKMQGFCE